MRTTAARRCGGYAASTRPRDVGTSIAAPTDWTTRKPISIGTLVDRAQAAEDARKHRDTHQETLLRLVRSASRPGSTSSAVYTIA